MGNGETEELTCMTHGHELRGGEMLVGGYRAEGSKEEKNMGQL